MLARHRTLALVAIVAAAIGLAWASSRSWGAGDASSDRPSISIDGGRSTAGAAVVERTSSFVRALTGDRPSKSRLPWELLSTCGIAGIAAVVVIWTRSNATDRWSRRQLRLLRRTVALRGPPSSHLV
jgi:hypothetical protein